MRLRPQRVLTLHARRAKSSRNSVLKTAMHRQTNDSKKLLSFFVGLLTCPLRGLIWACFNDRQARSITTASTVKKSRRQNAAGYFLCRLAHRCAARSNLGLGSSTGRRGAVRSSACPHTRSVVYFLGLVLCRNKYKCAVIARFHNVAKGNISRLRDAQAFHAAVKRPPYFTVARQRRHFTAGHSLPGLRGLIWGLVCLR